MQIPVSKWNIFFLCLGSLVIIFGVTILSLYVKLYDNIITSALAFGNGTEAFKAWQKPKTPITMDIYFFNWTNPEDIHDPDIKPRFEELGPYRFKQMKEKTNITWHNENRTISYQYLKYFYFDEENSPRNHSDVITTINMVALTAAEMASDWHIFFKIAVTRSINSAPIYVRKNVSQLLFEGYEDPILVSASSIPFISKSDSDRFGWFYGRNGSVGGDGIYNMIITPNQEYGTLKTWNYSPKTTFYESNCSDILGSAGELYPRNVKPTAIKFFSPEMCRTVQFNFEANVSIKGVHSYKFSPGIELLDNGDIFEGNQCFANSHPSGVLYVASCREDAPVYLSLPHFYNADKSYVNAVEGMYPEKDLHELYLTLEPITGIISDISARMQVNVLMQPLPDFELFKDVPKVMFPVFWFDQKVTLSDELVSTMLFLFNLPKMMEIVALISIILGLLCIIVTILYVACLKKKRSQERRIPKEEIPLNSKS